MKKLKIRLKKSPISCTKKQKESIRTLGFKKTYQTIEIKDHPSLRGKIYKMQHYVELVK